MPAKAQRFKSTPTPNSAKRYSNGSKISPRALLLIRTSPGCAKSPFIASMRFAPTSKPSHGSAILKERSRISEPSSRNSFKMSRKSIFRVGVDTGGTFTDFVVIHDRKIEVFKELSTPLDQDHLQTLINRLRSENVESVAVSLLYSFANTEHENKVLCALEPLRLRVSLSSRILPEYREYERTSTTVINAYLAPLMSRYLRQLTERLPHGSLRVMQSNGGTMRAKTAADAPVKTILSGPAGGVVGAFHVAQACGYSRVITFDMGGTSTDVSLCDGDVKVTHEGQIDGMPIGISMMDIHSVGAGGGSIAELDAGGALKVGHQSAD